jgi:tRNA threonylcarbamoyladenosine biosynthesis protein TsaB
MPTILHIDTATQFCSVALIENRNVVSVKAGHEKNAHSRVITVFIDEIFKENKIAATTLDAIAVSRGPGSYTGLRIGVSTAKGLCYALDKPLIAVSTLQAMAEGMAGTADTIGGFPANSIFCPMIDARRMEVYCALFDKNNTQLREIKAEIIDENSFADVLKTNPVVFAGDGAEKCREVLGHQENAFFMHGFEPSAAYMGNIAAEKFHNNHFEDVAYFEPFYLKDFIAGLPKVKGLRADQ